MTRSQTGLRTAPRRRPAGMLTPHERKRIYRLLREALTGLHIAHTLTPQDLPTYELMLSAERAVASADKSLRRVRLDPQKGKP